MYIYILCVYLLLNNIRILETFGFFFMPYWNSVSILFLVRFMCVHIYIYVVT